jgi:hypothetical protein
MFPQTIPDEIWLKIFNHLDSRHYFSLKLTCKTFLRISNVVHKFNLNFIFPKLLKHNNDQLLDQIFNETTLINVTYIDIVNFILNNDFNIYFNKLLHKSDRDIINYAFNMIYEYLVDNDKYEYFNEIIKFIKSNEFESYKILRKIKHKPVFFSSYLTYSESIVNNLYIMKLIIYCSEKNTIEYFNIQYLIFNRFNFRSNEQLQEHVFNILEDPNINYSTFMYLMEFKFKINYYIIMRCLINILKTKPDRYKERIIEILKRQARLSEDYYVELFTKDINLVIDAYENGILKLFDDVVEYAVKHSTIEIINYLSSHYIYSSENCVYYSILRDNKDVFNKFNRNCTSSKCLEIAYKLNNEYYIKALLKNDYKEEEKFKIFIQYYDYKRLNVINMSPSIDNVHYFINNEHCCISMNNNIILDICWNSRKYDQVYNVLKHKNFVSCDVKYSDMIHVVSKSNPKLFKLFLSRIDITQSQGLLIECFKKSINNDTIKLIKHFINNGLIIDNELLFWSANNLSRIVFDKLIENK